jgi:hypothetical protein
MGKQIRPIRKSQGKMIGPEKPLVSVRLKTFNYEKYISMALNVILSQEVDIYCIRKIK